MILGGPFFLIDAGNVLSAHIVFFPFSLRMAYAVYGWVAAAAYECLSG